LTATYLNTMSITGKTNPTHVNNMLVAANSQTSSIWLH